jgi:hypothetical protein
MGGAKRWSRRERMVRRPFLKWKSIDLLKSARHIARKPQIVRIQDHHLGSLLQIELRDVCPQYIGAGRQFEEVPT